MVLLSSDRMDSLFSPRCVWVNGPIIIGAGPSGLAVGASLREQGVPYVMLEREDCIASLWQQRTYDRLKLHLPKQFCQLPRMPFPADYPEYPTRRQFIDYLENYAATFGVKPEFGSTVQSARYGQTSGLWRVHSSSAASSATSPAHPRQPRRLILGNLAGSGIRRPAIGPLTLKNMYGKTPVLDTGALAKIRSGEITVVPGVSRFTKSRAELTDGTALDLDAVVITTGYRSNVPQWLQDTDFFGKDGYPTTAFQPGLYSVGLRCAWASVFLHGLQCA